jgi:predicted RNA-binding protein Jag
MSDAAEVEPFDHRAQVEELLGSILRLMEYPARLDFKDMSDGALGVAVHFEGELPGITPGKRSYLVDCLQFLLNKAINRPNVPRRWVNLGVNTFPETRGVKAPEATKVPAPPPSEAPKQAAPPPPPPPKKEPRPPPKAAPERPHHKAPEEAVQVAVDPTWAQLGGLLAEKAQKQGRLYAVMMLSNEQRAKLLKAVAGKPGVSARAEGDGHWRRLTVTPDKVAPLPKKLVMPDWDDEEDE